MRQLLPVTLQNEIPLREIITHVLPLNNGVAAYDIFANRCDNAIKVLLKPNELTGGVGCPLERAMIHQTIVGGQQPMTMRLGLAVTIAQCGRVTK
jgi:hypothetical protein